MTAWLSEVYAGTDLDTDFQTLNDLLDTVDMINPDFSFVPFGAIYEAGDGSRVGVGFPTATLKWAALPDEWKEAIRALWDGKLSAPLYWRLPINQLDIYGEPVWRTFLAQALYPYSGEDEQAGHTLSFVIELRHMAIQPEAI